MTAPGSMSARLVDALARYDQKLADCPVNNPKGRKVGGDDRCPRCGADASQNCGLNASASDVLINELRALAETEAA